MIQTIIENLWSSVECLGLFEKIFPLVEKKENGQTTFLVSYTGNGNYEQVQNFDNYNGLAYFRQTEDANIESVESQYRSCDTEVTAKYAIRLVACIQREQLPEDCAFADDAFGWLMAKELIGRGGSLKTNLNASKVFITASKIITDRKKLLGEEFTGDNVIDINYNYSYIGVDLSIEITIRQSCIIAMCDTYYIASGSCTPRVITNGVLRATDPTDTTAGVYSYIVNIPSTATILSFQLGQLNGAANDCTLTYLTANTSTFIITSTDLFIMDQPYKLVIFYK